MIPARARSSLAWCAGRRRTIDCGFPMHRLSSTTKSPAMEPCALGIRHGLHSGGGAATLMVGTASQLDRTESYLWISGQSPSRITASAAPISSARPIRPDAGRRSRPSPHPAAPRANTAQAEDHGLDNLASCHPPTTITLPWTAPSFAAVKGIVHAPCAKPAMRPESRDALLIAIAKARGWIDDIRLGRIGSFAEIAEREGQGERHIRLLAPLPSFRLASLRRSSMAPRLRTSRSLASPRPCPKQMSAR